ncbi:uncharacterized protein LOC105207097 isoform X1 [Solenopsis invicta]|uniref:uncharacterized protein LOC105207097 isoform X1 n=1 Tax=Solenopsis invicta TaxID=13686 RepID=UPI00193DE8A2|nr:uncharacterized protein LOC105207097 isoform X1 [Solenopsis invicta]XP_039302862.1 uncharacterized protein LOC105207097 isoform X1 [Solenopsis invicta]XP_039302863.1 uncharacterized protein LOC105207097 isoform X1 [Solenopsis invicta]XP_039302864.1 uncharacterized protein LOC105207097 isoform X1 [Solenopsis invicta]XP_039302865.1 uncharacterized protein LOC105207097 isoform X1 [Solenopsis invicta]XP_039302866.1 uncharacterized protein LOC105207097 isoform X1 [Solenopsis invicta]XP_03930286
MDTLKCKIQLGRCYGRKPYQKLSTRQKQRIISRIEINNISSEKTSAVNENSYNQDVSDEVINNSFNNDILFENISIDENSDKDISIDENNEKDTSIDQNCDNYDNNLDVHNHYNNREIFKKKLAQCFVTNNISLKQGDEILKVLRTHECLTNLPRSCKTLIHTPRSPVDIKTLEPGQYVHFNIKKVILEIISHIPHSKIPNVLLLDFSTDGVSLYKASNVVLWPIHIRIINIPFSTPALVGLYKGYKKPNNATAFFLPFISDIKKLLRHRLKFNEMVISIQLRCFVADAPARAFILNHVGHNAFSPCSKCTVQGQNIGHRMVFLNSKCTFRSDDKYRMLAYKKHNLGETPLSQLLNDLINQVPFESMHLVYLGVAKKILVALITGEYNKKIKLKSSETKLLSSHLELIQKYCPTEFSRRQRNLTEYVRYKATEYRQFLLYTGPVIFYNLLDKSIYLHFLMLTTAIRILNLPILSEQLLTFADIALKKFVERCPYIYGVKFMSYNVHGLLHITEDVRRYGPLDSFSAFAYENEMSKYRKLCRKPDLLLEQIFNRMDEQKKNDANHHLNDPEILIARKKHFNGPTYSSEFEQYKTIEVKNTVFSTSLRNNCCMLHDLSICIIINI